MANIKDELRRLKDELQVVEAAMRPPNHPLGPMALKQKLQKQARLQHQIDALQAKLKAEKYDD
jgi:hypothetical protein